MSDANLLFDDPNNTVIANTISVGGSGKMKGKARDKGKAPVWVPGLSATRLTQ